MHVVAVLDTTPGAEEHAERIAARIGGGITALDVRMALSGVLPRVLFRTPSPERAEAAVAALESAGIPAEAVDLASVTPVARMVRVHRFALEAEGLRADTGGPLLPYGSIVAIARVAADTSVQRTTHERDIEVVRGRAVQRDFDVTRTEHALEQALVLFVRDEVSWVVRASEARYLGLGALLKRTQIENLVVLASLLRERAPQTAYDERFLAHPLARAAEARVRDHDAPTLALADAALDVRLHLLGRVLAGGLGRGAYR